MPVLRCFHLDDAINNFISDLWQFMPFQRDAKKIL